MAKDSLVFDTTGVFADQDKVGAYVLGAGGQLVTSTTDSANSKERLDVLSVLADEAGNTVNITAGALDVNLASPITIDVDLDHTTGDSVRIGDGTSLVTTTTVGSDVGLDVNLINALIAVTATDLDIRDLAAASDSIQSWLRDGAGTALTSTLVGSDQALDVNVVASAPLSIEDVALANTAIASAALSVAAANVAEDVVASPLTDRKYLFVYNNDNQKMYIGGAGVSTATGFPVSPGSVLMARVGDAVDVQVVTAKPSHNVRTLQLA